ncbi:MAG: hypothetical protein KatS3mg102_1403 [Planctomycetota bacterium]|nr:MAG: hypothetical protein KatS3mg102_1403 [Planctomycetota bacterium]
MRWWPAALMGPFVLMLLGGCGGGAGGGAGALAGSPPAGGAGSGSSAAPSPSPSPSPSPAPSPAPGPFEVVRAEPAHGAQPSTVSQVRVVFNREVDAASIAMRLADPFRSTFLVLEQLPGAPNASVMPGQLAVQGAEVRFVPQASFLAGFTYGVVLTDGVRDRSGIALSTGSVSGPRTVNVPGVVFQAVFQVTAPPTGGGTGSGGGPSGGGASAPDPHSLLASFVEEPGSDLWFIDFAVAGTFDGDLRARGLATGSASVDAWARARVMQRVLSYCGIKYFRQEDGRGIPGRSYAISFVAEAPPGQPGVHYSRHSIGGRGSRGTLGVSFFDPGNRNREDNSPRTGTGVFSSSIHGVRSVLSPALRSSELRFVDGSYQLGQGTASEDARFIEIREALLDYGMAIGLVLAHEVGHSVGLDHDRAGSLSIMSAALSERMLSNPNMEFSQTARALLDRNLGFTR